MLRVGQKVVCVDVEPKNPRRVPVTECLKLGAVYTIRTVGDFPWPLDRVAGAAVWLAEIHRHDPHPEFVDYPFAASRFRPVVERGTETGMAILRRIADDVREKIPAN